MPPVTSTGIKSTPCDQIPHHPKVITDQVTGTTLTNLDSLRRRSSKRLTHSDYVLADPGGAHLTTKPNTEFRGHSHVTETGPDGRVVETWYKQDDIYKGQAYQTQVTDGAGNIYTQSDHHLANQENPTYNLPHPEGQPANSDLEIYWVYTSLKKIALTMVAQLTSHHGMNTNI